MSSRSNGFRSAYLVMISVATFTIAVIVACEINHLLHSRYVDSSASDSFRLSEPRVHHVCLGKAIFSTAPESMTVRSREGPRLVVIGLVVRSRHISLSTFPIDPHHRSCEIRSCCSMNRHITTSLLDAGLLNLQRYDSRPQLYVSRAFEDHTSLH